jgi:hypothetical protein
VYRVPRVRFRDPGPIAAIPIGIDEYDLSRSIRLYAGSHKFAAKIMAVTSPREFRFAMG